MQKNNKEKKNRQNKNKEKRKSDRLDSNYRNNRINKINKNYNKRLLHILRCVRQEGGGHTIVSPRHDADEIRCHDTVSQKGVVFKWSRKHGTSPVRKVTGGVQTGSVIPWPMEAPISQNKANDSIPT